MQFERRYSADIRANDEGRLIGYAVVWDARSLDLGGFVEVVKRGAFDRTLLENPDVVAVVEHDMAALSVLGRTTNGTLRLVPDDHGLRAEIDLPDTQTARDVIALVRRGDINSMSFRFRPYPGGSAIDTRSTPPLRTLSSVQLAEVSVVLSPAYPDTSVAVRALEDAQREDAVQLFRRLRLELAEAQ